MTAKPILCALDIGSTKVSIFVSEVSQDGFKVLGKGVAQHKGVKQGAIVNISETSEAIKKAKRDAELSSGQDVREVYVSFGGLSVKSFPSNGLAAVEDQVREQDIQSALKTARAVVFPDDREIIHALPKDFILDGLEGIKDPIGMTGVRLESQVSLITGARTALPNLMKCVESAGLRLKDFVLQAYASSLSVLTEEEKELGVCLVEMGGGTSEWIIYKDGVVVSCGAVGVGGNNFTHDLAVGLRTSSQNAEKIKLDYGSCFSESTDEESVEIKEVGSQNLKYVSKKQISDILEPRALETLQLIYQDIEASGFAQDLAAGLVFTGGASQLEGLVKCAEQVVPQSVRAAAPQMASDTSELITDPGFSCSVGLLYFAGQNIKYKDVTKTKSLRPNTRKVSSHEEPFKSFGKQFKDFIGL